MDRLLTDRLLLYCSSKGTILTVKEDVEGNFLVALSATQDNGPAITGLPRKARQGWVTALTNHANVIGG